VPRRPAPLPAAAATATGGAADDLFLGDPDIVSVRSAVPISMRSPNAAITDVDRRALGRGPGMERPGTYLCGATIPNNGSSAGSGQRPGQRGPLRLSTNSNRNSSFDFQGRQLS